jgi:hypothetical protein
MKLWTGRPLSELLPVLRAELPRAGRRLPSGAHVGLEQREDALRLWLWRDERPRAPDWQARWTRECGTFLRHLGCEGWHPIPDQELESIELPPVVAAFDEPVAA